MVAAIGRRTGLCPTVDAPVAQRDGYLVRIALVAGRVRLDQLRILCELAAECGNGVIELTSRANVQLRGFAAGDLASVRQTLEAAGLGDRDDRLVLLAPFAGLDPAEHADPFVVRSAVLSALAPVERAALAPKFHIGVDCGGSWDWSPPSADVTVVLDPVGAVRVGVAGGEPADVVSLAAAAQLCADVARQCIEHGSQARARDVVATPASAPRRLPDGSGHGPVGPVALRQRGFVAAVPLARPSVAQLRELVTLAADLGNDEVRVLPWGSLLIPRADAALAAAALRRIGFAVDANDPAVGVICCSGASGCWSTELDTLGLATQLLTTRPDAAPAGSIVHVSGCAKSCAHHGAAAVTLVGRDDSSGFDPHPGSRAEQLVG